MFLFLARILCENTITQIASKISKNITFVFKLEHSGDNYKQRGKGGNPKKSFDVTHFILSTQDINRF